MINLAQKDIAHSLGKFIITAMGVGMLLGVVLIMIGVYRGMIVDAGILIEDIGAQLWVVQENTLGPFAESSRVHEDLKDTVSVMRGVDKSEAITFQNLQLINDKGDAVRVFSIGYDPYGAFKVVNPDRLIEGRGLNKQHYEMVVSEKTGFILNERIQLGRDIYTVVGITRGTTSSAGDPLIYISLKDAQQLQFLYSNAEIRNDMARGMNSQNSPMANAVIATVKSGFSPEEVAGEIQRWKHKSVYTLAEEKSILAQNLLKWATKQIGMFTVILVIVSSIIIALIIYTMTLEKIKEISILKLIGIPNWMIVKMIMQETLVLGMFAFVFGNIFAHLIYSRFPRRVVLEMPDAWMLFGVIILASILSSFFGVRKVIKADPAAAIGG
ncbi:MAG: ABC transporter permease [Thermodesulfovibrionia bacterium]|nr:ABC transporter permease [Thermodesulfovibrionia bacterium]